MFCFVGFSQTAAEEAVPVVRSVSDDQAEAVAAIAA